MEFPRRGMNQINTSILGRWSHFIFLFYFWVTAEIQNCVEMAFPALSSLFKCYQMFSNLFMDQINIQSFCQVESELFHDVRFDIFRKWMPIGAHKFPTLLKRVGGREISVDTARVSTKNWYRKHTVNRNTWLQTILDRMKEHFHWNLNATFIHGKS